jgi:hypothetical protein
MTRSNYGIETSVSGASGGYNVLTQSVGKVSFTHVDASGTYNLITSYHDEHDGQGRMQLAVNGRIVDDWSLNRDTSSWLTRSKTLTLKTGDLIEVIGTRHAGEYARLDYVDVVSTDGSTGTSSTSGGTTTTTTPTTTTYGARIQAEDMRLSNYRVESIGNTDGGESILTDGTGKAAVTFSGASGTYAVKVRYHDEDDGQGSMQLAVNGRVVDSWNLNLDTASWLTRSKTLSLNTGDVVEVIGTRHASEYARVDYIEIGSASGSTTTSTSGGSTLSSNSGSTSTGSGTPGTVADDLNFRLNVHFNSTADITTSPLNVEQNQEEASIVSTGPHGTALKLEHHYWHDNREDNARLTLVWKEPTEKYVLEPYGTLKQGQDHWIKFWMYYDDANLSSQSPWGESLIQVAGLWDAADITRTPEFAIRAKNGGLAVYHRADQNAASNGIHTGIFSPYDDGGRLWNLKADKWVEYVAHIKLDPWGNNAILELWQDGYRLIRDTGAFGYNDQSRQSTVHLGIYDSWFRYDNAPNPNATKTVYFDELQIVTGNISYSDIAETPFRGNAPDVWLG